MLALAPACFEERDRPGPPAFAVTLDTTGVHSPDTLTGFVRVSDPDGIDSLWLLVDSIRFGQDGFFRDVINAPFVVDIPPSRPLGSRVNLRFEARDVAGFLSGVDTFVVIVP